MSDAEYRVMNRGLGPASEVEPRPHHQLVVASPLQPMQRAELTYLQLQTPRTSFSIRTDR